MKWGFTDGVKNGARTAQEFIQGVSGQNYHTGKAGSANFQASVRSGSPTSKAYRIGQSVRSFPKDFRESVDDTVGTWIDDQKDFYRNANERRKSARDYLRGLRRGRGKAGSVNFNANVRNRAFNKGVAARNKIVDIGRDMRGSIDDTVGTWIDDQKDFWRRKK